MEDFLSKEWLITNGIGGYASSSISCANTRTYHGMLVASFNPPVDRVVVVPKVEERIYVNGNYQDLATNRYQDGIYPDGFDLMKDFKLQPCPTWVYANNDWKIEKSIVMVSGSNTTILRYKNTGSVEYNLELHPLFSYCNFHQCRKENPQTDFFSEIFQYHIKTYPYYQSAPFYTSWTEGNFVVNDVWYKNIKLLKEEFRGLDDIIDYFRVGYISHILKPGEEMMICLTTENFPLENSISELYNTRLNQLTQLSSYKSEDRFFQDLLESGEQFIVDRNSTESKTILAGYHWFSDWGRDILISMRGLTISTGKKDISESILNTLLSYLDGGMLPNRFPDYKEDEVEYNSVDAALWTFVTLFDYFNKFDDLDFIASKMDCLHEILENYSKGTRFNIHEIEEGFIYVGEEGFQLTWMDAKVNGEVITPRIGCPVEITMLWYNALKIYQFFCDKLKIEIASQYTISISKIEANFRTQFFNDEGFLNDVVIPNEKYDVRFRPNQIYALSLPYTILNKDEKISVFDKIKEKLYTPYGLRTLNVEDKEFIGEYSGDQWSRDNAYHQGTVWPFLLYEYFKVYFDLYGISLETKRHVLGELEALKKHFYEEEGLHCISEIFDGLNPSVGKGCINQAWSVAALLKLYIDFELDKG